MNYLVGDSIGMVHLIASCLSLIFGTMILFMEKGTKRHVKVGYLYVINMAILIVTAFMIYRLFNGWGVFHYLTVLSLFTILMGMVPIWLKKPVKRWKYFHYAFMYWSVMGLYAAFVAEMITRIPETPFFGMVGISIGIIMTVGGICFGMKMKKWEKILNV